IGHGAFPDSLISQPELTGIGERRPDFMWIARNSAMVQPALIEIESPSKRWVAGKGKSARPSADFTQALNQLWQWGEWLARPASREVFLERYGVPATWRHNERFVPSSG
ncbi:MAG: Shedu anti-phage system protein SduA domain-containing protein, partial [Solirubrobacteraceae bacterium]